MAGGRFNWKTCYEAEKLLKKQVTYFLRKNTKAKKISDRMKRDTSTRFFDWIDHIKIPESRVNKAELRKVGYKKSNSPKGLSVYRHPGSTLFPLVVHKGDVMEIALKVERVADFKKVHKLKEPVRGKALSLYREVVAGVSGNTVLTAVERHGSSGFEPDVAGVDVDEYKNALRAFRKRSRSLDNEKKQLQETLKLVKSFKLNKGRVADAWFRVEREYWQKRCVAGQVQKKRQDTLGLGWANHDHHTYRCSRENYPLTIKILQALGMEKRERFYAGPGAGWGAQVLEHPVGGFVVFADVDMTHKETKEDFSVKGFTKRKGYGTVGLWCALHGDSILKAGMHHLEAVFDHKLLKKDLLKKGVKTMKPFSQFPFLKQAFTEGETWKVHKSRASRLLKEGEITQHQCDYFTKKGTIGSHLENLERNGGYKGFNQRAVDVIIKATDARKHIPGA